MAGREGGGGEGGGEAVMTETIVVLAVLALVFWSLGAIGGSRSPGSRSGPRGEDEKNP